MKLPRAAVFVVVAVGVCFAGVSASGGSTGTATGTAAKPSVVKLGHLTSLTGAISAFGVPLAKVLALEVKQINDHGGFTVGKSRYKLGLTTVDDQSNQQVAIAGATQLIRDDGIKFLFGPIGPLSPAVSQLTQPAKVIQFTASSASAQNAGQPGYSQLFAVLPNLNVRVSTAVQGIRKFAPNAKRIAILGQNDQTWAAAAGPFTTALKAAGLTVINSIYPVGTTDLSSVLTNLASQKPDLIIYGWLAQDITNGLNQFSAAGISKNTTVFLAAQSGALCDKVGGRQCIYDPLLPADITSTSAPRRVQALRTAYLNYTHQQALPTQTQELMWYWDPVRMLIDAMKKAGTTTDTVKIGKALQTITSTGLVGPVSFNKATNSLKQGIAIFSRDQAGNVTSQVFH